MPHDIYWIMSLIQGTRRCFRISFFTFSYSFFFLWVSSSKVPLMSFEAFEGSFSPSREKEVPPSRFSFASDYFIAVLQVFRQSRYGIIFYRNNYYFCKLWIINIILSFNSGRSILMICQMMLKSTPKYSWTRIFLRPINSLHSIFRVLFRIVSESRLDASPIISNCLMHADCNRVSFWK